MTHITALYGSPRRQGNTARLLQQAVAGAREQGAAVTEIVLRDERATDREWTLLRLISLSLGAPMPPAPGR